MTDHAWEKLVDMIDTKFEIDKHAKSEEAIDGQPSLKRHIDAIFFEKDNQKYKIERVTSPAIKDTKTHYVHRGAAQRVQQNYDPHETSSKVIFYKAEADGYYNEISPEDMIG